MSRRAQDAVRDQLVAAALAERPRRRRRTTAAIAATVALLGATAVAEATGLIGMGEPIESLVPPKDAEQLKRYRAQDGVTVAATTTDPGYHYGWGVGIYTSAEGKDCVIAGNVVGNALGRERDGRFHRYGKGVAGSCGDLDRLPLMSDSLRIHGEHPRTLVYGRTAQAGRRVVFEHRGVRRAASTGAGGAFLVVFDGVLGPSEFRLVH